jgi:hypothetical protein
MEHESQTLCKTYVHEVQDRQEKRHRQDSLRKSTAQTEAGIVSGQLNSGVDVFTGTSRRDA